jgi:S1-C subfamily serine protease
MNRILHGSIWCGVALALLLLTGCAQYHISVKPAEDLSSYRKVYVASYKVDTMYMQGLISARLQKAGFSTVNINPEIPPVGTQGSGFILDAKGHILTCAHVVDGHQEATVWIKGKRYPGKVLATDTNADVGLILLDGTNNSFQPLPFARNRDYQLGEDIYTMGFPMAEELGNSVHLTKGLISATAGLRDDPKRLQISAQIQPGNSGGPLLDAKGEAIGMVAATYNPVRLLLESGNSPQNINFAIKNSTIEDFLKKVKYGFPLEAEPSTNRSLNTAENSVVLVRAGDVEDKDVNVPSLFCAYHYWVAGDYTHLQAIKLQFMDLKTFKVVLTVEARDFSFALGHGEMLDELFSRMCAEAFATRPNPFKK